MIVLFWLPSVAIAALSGYALARAQHVERQARLFEMMVAWMLEHATPSSNAYEKGRVDGFMESATICDRTLNPTNPKL